MGPRAQQAASRNEIFWLSWVKTRLGVGRQRDMSLSVRLWQRALLALQVRFGLPNVLTAILHIDSPIAFSALRSVKRTLHHLRIPTRHQEPKSVST